MILLRTPDMLYEVSENRSAVALGRCEQRQSPSGLGCLTLYRPIVDGSIYISDPEFDAFRFLPIYWLQHELKRFAVNYLEQLVDSPKAFVAVSEFI